LRRHLRESGTEGRHSEEWRKRVGIEPTVPGVSLEPDGFEGRAGHQTRIASVDSG